MGIEAVVSGYIVMLDIADMEPNLQAIRKYPFDIEYPFIDIFWGGSPAQFFQPVIGFTGSLRPRQMTLATPPRSLHIWPEHSRDRLRPMAASKSTSGISTSSG